MAGIEGKEASTAAKQIYTKAGANQTKEILHRAAAYRNPPALSRTKRSRKSWRCPLSGASLVVQHSVCVFVVLPVCLGSHPGVRPFLPLYPTQSMSAATFSLPSIPPPPRPLYVAGIFIYLLFIQLGARRLWPV